MKQVLSLKLPIVTTWSELFQNSYCAVSGKVKLMDYLSLVRQIHDKQYHSSLMVDWLTEKGFHDYYQTFRDYLAGKIIKMDNISQEQARESVKKSFWEYLQVYMAMEQKGLRVNSEQDMKPSTLSLRVQVGNTFPALKTLYRKHFRPYISDKKQIHYEVTNPKSPYYDDFQAVVESFTINTLL